MRTNRPLRCVFYQPGEAGTKILKVSTALKRMAKRAAKLKNVALAAYIKQLVVADLRKLGLMKAEDETKTD